MQRNDIGHVEVITGCMFAGKTEELLRRLRRAQIAGQEVTVFSPEIDDRYGTETIGTHNGETWDAIVVETSRSGMKELRENALGSDVIAVDEANFFENRIVETVDQLANDGKRVIVSGIDQTFRGEPFEPVHELMAISDEVEKLSAVCEECGGKATRTQRLINGSPAPEDAPTILVGGNESYEARCRDCHTVPS